MALAGQLRVAEVAGSGTTRARAGADERPPVGSLPVFDDCAASPPLMMAEMIALTLVVSRLPALFVVRKYPSPGAP